MNITLRSSLVGLAVVTAAATASATPLSLYYTVSSNGASSFRYDFSLILDNHDSSWVAGQSFSWIVFGDAVSATTPLTNFVGTTAPAPFTSFTTTGGGHNGPTLLSTFPGKVGWVPSAVGDQLNWSGTSSVSLGQGKLLFSNLSGTGVHADFAVAKLGTPTSLASAVPEPATYGLVLAGLLGCAALGRTRRKG